MPTFTDEENEYYKYLLDKSKQFVVIKILRKFMLFILMIARKKCWDDQWSYKNSRWDLFLV